MWFHCSGKVWKRSLTMDVKTITLLRGILEQWNKETSAGMGASQWQLLQAGQRWEWGRGEGEGGGHALCLQPVLPGSLCGRGGDPCKQEGLLIGWWWQPCYLPIYFCQMGLNTFFSGSRSSFAQTEPWLCVLVSHACSPIRAWASWSSGHIFSVSIVIWNIHKAKANSNM